MGQFAGWQPASKLGLAAHVPPEVHHPLQHSEFSPQLLPFAAHAQPPSQIPERQSVAEEHPKPQAFAQTWLNSKQVRPVQQSFWLSHHPPALLQHMLIPPPPPQLT
jgi:hypothetical protein